MSRFRIAIDIKFCSDPNAFNCKKKGVLPVTIFGTEDFDLQSLDSSSMRLCPEGFAACTGAPRDWSFADRGDPTSDIGAPDNINFREGSCAAIPLEDASVDCVVSFSFSEVRSFLSHSRVTDTWKHLLEMCGMTYIMIIS